MDKVSGSGQVVRQNRSCIASFCWARGRQFINFACQERVKKLVFLVRQ